MLCLLLTSCHESKPLASLWEYIKERLFTTNNWEEHTNFRWVVLLVGIRCSWQCS